MKIECLRWHVEFVGRRVSRETLGDGVVSVYLDIGDVYIKEGILNSNNHSHSTLIIIHTHIK